MARIIAGLFEDRPAAKHAIERLKALGVAASDVTRFVVNPPGMHHALPGGGDQPVDPGAEGGAAGAATGAVLGGIVGTVAGAIAIPLVGPAGMAAGVGAGALVGSLVGATTEMGQDAAVEPSARPGGVMVAVHATSIGDEPVIEIMDDCGAKLVEIADGQWRDGDWVDFDPVGPPKNVVLLKGNPSYPT